MKFNITHQRLFAAFSTLFAITIIGVIALACGDFTNIEQLDGGSLLTNIFDDIWGNHPAIQIIATLALTTMAIISTGRLVAKYKLFTTSYYIQMPLMGLIAWGVAQSSCYLLSATIIYISAQLLGSLLSIVRNGVSPAEIFNTSLYASVLAILYPAAIVLWAIVPLSLIAAHIPLRDWFIAAAGLLFPPLATIYISWLIGGEALGIVQSFWQLLLNPSGLLAIEELPLFEASVIALTALLGIIAILIILFTESTHQTKVRLFIIAAFAMLCSSSILIPSASIHTLSLATPAVALLATMALIYLPRWFSNFAYFLLIILFILDFAIPLNLPI